MTTAADAKEQGKGIHVHKSVTVNRPADEVYAFWRDFENLPRFMKNLESVQVTGDRRSHWVANGPAGQTLEWDAETTEDRPSERIAWRSLEGADVSSAGVVRFVAAPGGRGTEIHVEMRYDPPGGKLGALFSTLFGENPSLQVDGDLRRFKQVMEIGEVLYSEASIADGLRPAQPPEAAIQSHEREESILAERSADAVAATSNRDRTSSKPSSPAPRAPRVEPRA
jgi:uncharacterized membrane protein